MTSPTPDLNDAVRGLFGDRDWPFKIMLGAFINCCAVGMAVANPLFLPLSFALTGLTIGYSLRVLRNAARGDLSKLPDWGDVLDLLVSGISWLAIYMGFGFFLLSVLSISLIVAAQTAMLKVTSAQFLPWAEGTFIVVFVLFNVFSFFLTVLMANFADEERMMAGFAWRKVLKRIFRQPGSFLTAWLCGSTIISLGIFVPALTFVGSVALPFCGFLSHIIALRMIGCVWAAGKEPGQLEAEKAKTQPA